MYFGISHYCKVYLSKGAKNIENEQELAEIKQDKKEVSIPNLEVSALTETKTQVTPISIKIEDKTDDHPQITINGEVINYDNKNFDYNVKLNNGENKFTVVATNNLGGKETKDVLIVCSPSTLELNVDKLGTVEARKVKIRGKVNDINDKHPIITINDEQVENKFDEFEYEVQLKEGENVFTVVATNSLGKETTQTIVGVYKK